MFVVTFIATAKKSRYWGYHRGSGGASPPKAPANLEYGTLDYLCMPEASTLSLSAVIGPLFPRAVLANCSKFSRILVCIATDIKLINALAFHDIY